MKMEYQVEVIMTDRPNEPAKVIAQFAWYYNAEHWAEMIEENLGYKTVTVRKIDKCECYPPCDQPAVETIWCPGLMNCDGSVPACSKNPALANAERRGKTTDRGVFRVCAKHLESYRNNSKGLEGKEIFYGQAAIDAEKAREK